MTNSWHLTASNQHDVVTQAERVFDLVWRVDFGAPGFCLIDLGTGTDSHAVRSSMVLLKNKLSEVGGVAFSFRSMGRFDQQETTKFHLDGAPAESMLILGYEPSNVCSRIFLADYCRCAFDLGIEPKQFLADFNPMFRQGEEMLSRYVTELPQPDDGHFRLLLINNGSLPFTEERKNPLGVMHKAQIVSPSESERRLVNSIMLTVGESDAIWADQQMEFVTTEKISKKSY
jgi:hypothetical protein